MMVFWSSLMPLKRCLLIPVHKLWIPFPTYVVNWLLKMLCHHLLGFMLGSAGL